MPRRLTALGLVLVLSATAPAQVYLLGSSDGNTNVLGRIDLVNNPTYTQISSSLGSQLYLGMTANGSGGFYSFAGAGGPPLRLSTITTTGTAAPVPTASSFSTFSYGIAQTGGTLYAFDGNTQKFGTVNTTTGQFGALADAPTVPFANGVYGGLAFTGGTMYGVGQDTGTGQGNLWSFNLTNGAATKIGSTNTLFTQMLAFGDGTNLYGIDSSKRLYQINTSTAALTQMGTQPISGSNIPIFLVGAVYITPVPEPGLVMGVAAAGVGLVRVVLRRRTAAKRGAAQGTTPPSAT